MKLQIKTLANADVGEMEVAESVFGIEPRGDILARVVRWQLAKRQAGTHKTQERGEVSRTKTRIYRQKGTGRARHGSANANLFRGGAVAHGPRVRSHAHKLPKKIRSLGMRSALSAKQAEGKLMVVDALTFADAKTKALKGQLSELNGRSYLFVGGAELDVGFERAARNLTGVDVLPQQGANVYDILRRDMLIMTRDAVEHLEARLK
ncbi:MAG: 50S ribosomal protein L4 [Alphaproteobacteria bacterium]